MQNFFISSAVVWMVFSIPLVAGYTLKNGSLIETGALATMSVQEHYSAAFNAYKEEKWEELIAHANILMKNFPGSPFAHEAIFFSGVGYFNQRDFEKADEYLARYLKKQSTCQYFEQAIGLRLSIAEEFRQGTKKHLFGVGSLPRWVPAGDDALSIYEEIIAALPHHDLAARALFGKGRVLADKEDHGLAIESFQNLIRRFPMHALAVDSYVEIGRMYLHQAKGEYPSPDFLALAEINLSKFQESFPKEAKIAEAEQLLEEMQEFYAGHLYAMAQFFERTKKPKAAYLYYRKLTTRYPLTKAASRAREKLSSQLPHSPEEQPATVADTQKKDAAI